MRRYSSRWCACNTENRAFDLENCIPPGARGKEDHKLTGQYGALPNTSGFFSTYRNEATAEIHLSHDTQLICTAPVSFHSLSAEPVPHGRSSTLGIHPPVHGAPSWPVWTPHGNPAILLPLRLVTEIRLLSYLVTRKTHWNYTVTWSSPPIRIYNCVAK